MIGSICSVHIVSLSHLTICSFSDDFDGIDGLLGDVEFPFELLDDGLDSLKAVGGPAADDEDLEETLRSIEAGKFDLDKFLLPDVDAEDADLESAEELLAGLELSLQDEDSLTEPALAAPKRGRRGKTPGPAAVGLEPGLEDLPIEAAALLESSEEAAAPFDLGADPPPLEEFKRLMESLGPDTIFDEEGLFDGIESSQDVEEELEEEPEEQEVSPELLSWHPSYYEGGEELSRDAQNQEKHFSWQLGHEDPAVWRVQIVSVVTNSSTNSTALDMVYRVYDHLRAGTRDDPRINYQTICYQHEDGSAVEELDDMVQMWLEGYNTYHLVDGMAMKEAWGAIMPHIMLSEKNLDAILEQVQWALHEDEMNGALLTPRLRRIRFRGGAQEMTTGFNTQFLDSEYSVVSVR